MKDDKEKKGITEEIQIPEGMQFEHKNGQLTGKNEKGEITKRMNSPIINIEIKDNKIMLSSKKQSKKSKRFIGTYRSHVLNIVEGLKEPYTYKLKICSGHFPMNVEVNNNQLIIKNFVGEKFPRKLNLKKGANVKVENEEIIVESPDKETAGQVAADIESATRRSNFDARIFQDGIFITEKAGKKIK